MKKIREAKNALNQLESLFERTKDELDKTRNFLYRMFLEHGTTMKGGTVKVPPSIHFSLGDDPDRTELRVMDLTDDFPTSKYQEILDKLKELE